MKIGKVFIGFDFILLLAVFYLVDNEGMFVLALIAAAVHELGHIIAIKLCSGKIDSIYLGVFGAQINMKMYPILSYKREIIIALAGPVAGAIFGILSSFFGMYVIAGFSLILTAFNLIPALPLDGGRAVKFLLLQFFDMKWQDIISKILNGISATALVMLVLYINIEIEIVPSMLIFCAFTATNFLKELF